MHCLIFCAGTNGDCFPLLTLARQLRGRGHRVTVMAPPVYAGSPVLEDIAFQPICTMREYEQFLADAGMLAGRYGLLFCRDHAVRWNLNAWRAIEGLNADDLLVVAPDQPFFWADVAAKSLYGCNTVRIEAYLPHFRKPFGTAAQLPNGRIQEYLSAALALRWHEAAMEAGIPAGGASLADLSRERLNILTVALWPDWLVGNHGEERNVRPFGFMLADPGCHQFAEPDLPPMQGHIVFRRGPTDLWPARFYSIAIAVCRKLGMQGLLLDGTPLGIDLPPELIWRRYVPLDRALENARAIVYGGGIGTVAAALKCGVPQIVVPRWFDQPRNAEWMRRVGVAAVIPPDRFTPEALCRQIARLTGSGGHRTRALELSSRIDSSADSARICEFLENLPLSRQQASSRHTRSPADQPLTEPLP